ncbi:hypothetical protein BCR44DRAFT_68316 [Catenaria anguillulae PL171]|uniref:Uncharacterized protein n=1 Tax=Catenaria anguillulae PL171 TaxID=765915 RepID=A0A1Y2HX19_9FUNG|nr:hypothetical protein BCR44DRAFT_68316 [Catenaria anguillulae PL171]
MSLLTRQPTALDANSTASTMRLLALLLVLIAASMYHSVARGAYVPIPAQCGSNSHFTCMYNCELSCAYFHKK